jgi:hypothetical protein
VFRRTFLLFLVAGSAGVLPVLAAVLYDQTDHASGNGAPAQEFEGAKDAYDCEGADDFVVTAPSWGSTSTSRSMPTPAAGRPTRRSARIPT